MEYRIPASLLVRRLSEILGRVRYGRETFIVERHNTAIARITPMNGERQAILSDAIRAWKEAGPHDPSFADDLERVGAADRPPRNPWGS